MEDKLTRSLLDQIREMDGQPGTVMDGLMRSGISSPTRRSSGNLNPSASYTPPGYNASGFSQNNLSGWDDESNTGAVGRTIGNALYGLVDGATLGLVDMGVKAAGWDDELQALLGDDELAKNARMFGSVASIIVPYAGVAKLGRAAAKGIAPLFAT